MSRMTKSWVGSIVAILFAAGCSGAAGPKGPAGPTGPAGVAGATGVAGTDGTAGAAGSVGPTGATGGAGAAAPMTGTVTVLVEEGTGSLDAGAAGPLAGVTVTATTTTGGAITIDGGTTGLTTTATTGGDGAATLLLPTGFFEVSFSLENYAPPAPVLVGVDPLQTVAVTAVMNEAASAKPAVTLVASPAGEIGYGNTTQITATATSPVGAALTYSWKNATAFGLGTVTGSGTTATVTLPTIAAANARQPDPTATGWQLGGFVSGYAIPAQFGVLPILSDTQGSTTAAVTVSDPYGQSTTATITVAAASPQTPTMNHAVGTRVYLNAGGPLANGQSWSLTAPATSKVTGFDNATAQFPSFIPDVPGKYVATLGTESLTIYASTWVGCIDGSQTTPIGGLVNAWNGSTPVPYGIQGLCAGCHMGDGANAIDEFTPWMGTRHALKMTYGMDGTAGFVSGEGCLSCHGVGFDPANQDPSVAGGLSYVAANDNWVYPAKPNPTAWANTPAAVQQLSNIQCENCHGPQGGGGGNLSAAHKLTDVDGTPQPFQSPRMSYAAEDCGICHASSTHHHHYSEWATPDPTHPSVSYNGGMGHMNLATAQKEGMTKVGGQDALNPSCGRCHTAQGFTEYVDNLQQGNVGQLSPTQQAAGVISVNTVQPQTCQSCHDPHQDVLDENGVDQYQLRVWGSVGLLPSGFGVDGMGAGAVCIVCHNSRNGAYGADPTTNATATAYLHEDTDPIGSNPTAGLGQASFSMGAPHEANQGDVFEGRNAYFLGNQTPMISPHSAVKDTCVGCHMENQPQTMGTTPETHLFWISDPEVPTLCSSCHANGTTNVDGASLRAAVNDGLARIAGAMGAAVKARINDAAGRYMAPTGYGAWTDTGVVVLGKVTDPVSGEASSAPITISTATNALVSTQVASINYMGLTLTLTFTSAVTVPGITNPVASFNVALGSIFDASGTNPMFAQNGNLAKAVWNYALIHQDESLGVHNPPFVTAVLSATVNPPANPNAVPQAPGGLWY